MHFLYSYVCKYFYMDNCLLLITIPAFDIISQDFVPRVPVHDPLAFGHLPGDNPFPDPVMKRFIDVYMRHQDYVLL